jgi:hypothetical protein
MGKGRFFVVRVGVLLLILGGVLVYAARDVLHRRARNAWQRPLRVGVVFLQPPRGSAAPSLEAFEVLSARLQVLEGRLNSEYQRYHPDAGAMFKINGLGRFSVSQMPPELREEGFINLVSYTYAMWRYGSEIKQAAEIATSELDSLIYVVTEPTTGMDPRQVEGYSEQGGQIGVAKVQLDESTVDLCLIVVAHELMHTLGAHDSYGADGRALIPDGLGDAAQQPLYPQRYMEVMARNRVLEPGREEVPETLEELRVGPVTARAIGWLR